MRHFIVILAMSCAFLAAQGAGEVRPLPKAVVQARNFAPSDSNLTKVTFPKKGYVDFEFGENDKILEIQVADEKWRITSPEDGHAPWEGSRIRIYPPAAPSRAILHVLMQSGKRIEFWLNVAK